jgi:hypothetical protein
MTCVECGDDYLWDKNRAVLGGKRTHCGDCSEETSVKYVGLNGADGKQASVSILRFQSEDDRKNYIDFWQSNTGLKTGKNCQIGRGLKSTPSINFQTVAVFEGNTNHKGKA